MSDERDTRHGAHDAEDDGTAVSVRPSGKRSARRARTSSEADTGAVATIDRPQVARKTDRTADKKKAGRGGNPFKRLVRFLREVIAELRKVIWPNRKQMVTYTSVVLVFVVFTVAFIAGLDLALIKGVNWLFG
ncbi:preprotein translocase subunit SecE [Nocardia terpenica]|uniref:Protein translocase subunit SecE n=1 Tax=Nocardia terpenica TaxID=455432 RepID=A0A164JTX8_9NOCA|nr:preprotein translocase subunit SecE [Nocardia terpenica]ATL70893.1 preprotein translocase subunit SecE [Nocardia terpenica]KZM70719.1 preprotein translocase subunit SecE [Nocardia terpenica]NQE90019.1 preprotein translocase subunit SecE [Nocardia terpenica]